MKISKLIILVTAITLAGGCLKSKSSLSDSPAKNSITNSASLACNFDQIVCDYYAAQANAMSKPSTMTISYDSKNPELKGSKMISQNDGKGNLHTINSDNGKVVTEMIVMGTVTYLKDMTDSKWLKITSDADSVKHNTLVSEIGNQVKELADSTQSAQIKAVKVKTESCGPDKCEVYDMFEVGKEAEKTTTWINQRTHLAAKITMTDKSGTITNIEYDYTPVVISEPSPIKELNLPKINPQSLPNDQIPDAKTIEDMMKKLPTNLGGDTKAPEPSN